MSRTWTSLVLALLLATALGACDEQQSGESGEPAAPTDTQQGAVPNDSSGGDQSSVPQGTE